MKRYSEQPFVVWIAFRQKGTKLVTDVKGIRSKTQNISIDMDHWFTKKYRENGLIPILTYNASECRPF